MARKDRNDTAVWRALEKKVFRFNWDCYTGNESVNKVLSHASKAGTGKNGYPDHIYLNESAKLLILVEDKPTVKKHESVDGGNPEGYAVDGVKHYLEFFLPSRLEHDLGVYFQGWKILGIAVSGDLEDAYNHRIGTFLIHDGAIEAKPAVAELLDERSYINLFDNIDEEAIVSEVSYSSKRINKWLRSVDSQKRPILLSALMICLYETKGEPNDFIASYHGWSSRTIVTNIIPTLRRVLSEESIPREKIEVIANELAFIDTDKDLNDPNASVLKKILDELNNVVIPRFNGRSSYDIIGKFYEEFLRFAGVANVKKGIVLTPRHIATLFTELIDMKYNDVVVDFACGTGSFLIAAMNRLNAIIDESDIPEKEEKKERVKSEQLVGFEKNATMYICAISNMMFRGDGKSNITYCDCFSTEADQHLAKLAERGIHPSIGFINPPYGGKDNKDNPTKKEIQFLTKMLDNVSRYGVVIAPLSTYFKNNEIRSEIVKRHTLKCVINMPHDLFMPNAAADTAIAVFETNKPQGSQKAIFTEIKDDGLILSKSRGRTDVYNRWDGVKRALLERLGSPDLYEDGLNLVQASVVSEDGLASEWILQAHSKIDYSKLSENDFVRSIKDYLVFQAKSDLNLLEADVDELTLLDTLCDYYTGEANG